MIVPTATWKGSLLVYANADPANLSDPAGRRAGLEWGLFAVEMYLIYQSIQAFDSFASCMTASLTYMVAAVAYLENTSSVSGVDMVIKCVANVLHDVMWDIPFWEPFKPGN